MPSITLKTLGEFVLTFDGRRLVPPQTKKARALIAYLAMHRQADVTREQLLELFWRDFDPQRARDNLNATLWSVRRMFRSASLDPDNVIRADRTIVRWHAAVEFDVDRLLELTERADQGAAEQALAIYCGDFLEGDFDDWAVAERERLALAYEALLSRATKGLGSTAAAEQLIGRNPYDELAYTTLIGSHLESGQTAAAAILVERCRRALEEVGATPSDEFEERFGRLQRPRDDPQAELQIPFVARGAELGLLAERLAQCADGIGSVTLVHGDAGIGKSTLLAHIDRIAPSNGCGIIEIRCGGNDREDLSKAADVVRAAAGPFIVVVDDAQHLAAEALSLFEEFVNVERERHAFIVATRPESLATLRSSLERYAPSEIALGPLSRADVDGALRQAAGSELSEVSAKLFDRSRGHPLYLVRLVEALVETGALERRSRSWNVTAKFDEALPLPGSVRTFIEARLLARGSVPATVAGALALEPSATAADLGSVLAMREEALLDALDDLLALGLIRQPRIGPQFEFAHDLIHEVAEARLNAGRAVRVRRRFAELLLRSPERTAPVRIAHHLLAAGDILDAGRAFVRVANAALQEHLFLDCVAACELAIGALPRLEPSPARDRVLAALHRTSSSAHFAIGDNTAALEDADLAVALERSADSAPALASSLMTRARCHAWAYEWILAINDLEEAATLARAAGDEALLAAADVGLSSAARARGDQGAALTYAREAHDLAVTAGKWPLAQSAIGESVMTCCAWWRIEDAERLAAKILELTQRCGETERRNYHNHVALVSYLRKQYAEAKRHLEAASHGDGRSLPPATFFNQVLSALVALDEERWGDVLDIADRLDSTMNSETLLVQHRTLNALRVTALLARDGPGDVWRAADSAAAFGDDPATIFPWNVPVDVTRAIVAARLERDDAEFSLRGALDATEERAHEVPFDVDRAYAQIELACRSTRSDVLGARAAAQRAFYENVRRAAAGGTGISLPIIAKSSSSEATPRTSS